MAEMPGTGTTAFREHMRAISRNAAASTMGASMVALCVTPLDVVKVRMQAHVCPVGGAVPCEDPAHVHGIRDAVRKIVRSDGVRGLWRGLNATLALAVPTTGLYFTMYEAFMVQLAMRNTGGLQTRPKKVTNGETQPESEPPSESTQGTSGPTWNAVLSGAAARTVTATVASPIELARVRLQAGASGSITSILSQVYREEGLAALWRGLAPTLVRDAPFSAIYWGAYEAMKDPARSPLPKAMFERDSSFAVYLAAGTGAGGLAALVTIPADVIKTRRQAATVASTNAPTSMREISRTIIQEEGVGGLFKGVGPRLIKVAPACAIMMGSYELFKQMLGGN